MRYAGCRTGRHFPVIKAAALAAAFWFLLSPWCATPSMADAADRAVPSGTFFGQVEDDVWEVTLFPDGRFTLHALADETHSDAGTWIFQDPFLLLTGGRGVAIYQTGLFSEGSGYQSISVREEPGGAFWSLARKPELSGSTAGESAGPPQTHSWDVITFGLYEQDNNQANGMEPIRWRVLAGKNGYTLVISEKNLDFQLYNVTYTPMTWEKCSLRTWLNGEFPAGAFTPEEQDLIIPAVLKNEANTQYGTEGGNDTLDRVFLLSASEAEEYFTDDSDRRARNTKYAIAKGTTASNGYAQWWLRSPGNEGGRAVFVNEVGTIHHYGGHIHNWQIAVRPAMWVVP